MKNVLLLLAGIAAATVCILASRTQRAPRTIDDLASQLKNGWAAEHHTIA